MTQADDLESLFFAALEKSDPAERASFLEAACGDDEAMRQSIERMLAAHPQVGSFLECRGADRPVERNSASGQYGITVDEPTAEKPGTVIGPYKLMEEIGIGGFGLVFVAEQQQPVRRKVALKVIKPGMDTREVIARFEAERQALALMDHPNIARVFDGGATPSGRPYFVMELVKGVPITEFCDQHQLPVRERLKLFIDVCQAIQHAHQKGVIHRDLKPANIMVSLHDATPVVKVIDFGVAKAIGQQLTEKTLYTGLTRMIGTPVYMSPEQAGMSDLDIDTRSDIYSLGVLLYELLTGTTPFDKARLRTAAYEEIRRIIREEDPPRPSARLSELHSPHASREEADCGTRGVTATLDSVSANRKSDAKHLFQLVRGELDWIVMKTLEKDRNRRYETASGFAADVQRYLNDEPVQACPPTTWYRFRKFARRNKRALATLGAFALALVVALGSLVVSNARISVEAKEKTKALEAAKASEHEAVENLKDALAAVDQMLTRVAEERLQGVPLMEPLRRDLLEDALKFYQKFLARRGNDPAIQREAALAYLRMASLHFWLGDYGKSEEAYCKGFATIDELNPQTPIDPGARGELVAYYIGYGLVLRNQDRFDDGAKALRRAVAVAEALLKEFPDSRPNRDRVVTARNSLANALVFPRGFIANAERGELEEAEQILDSNLDLTQETTSFSDRAQTYRNLGMVLRKQGRAAEAETACRQGVLLFEKALAKSPASRWLQVGLADTLKELAGVVEANGGLREAEALCRRAIPLFDQAAADFPSGPTNRWNQVGVHFQHAQLLSRLKRSAEAEQAYLRTVELQDKLAEDFPKLPGFRWSAVEFRRLLAEFLAGAGRVEEAHQEYAKAAGTLETLEASDRSKALARRGHFYGALGEWDKAAADFTKAIELGSEDVLGVWYPLAVLHLRAQRTKEYRDLCEQLLKRLGQSGGPYVVIICKLAPESVADLSRPVQIGERLVALEPQNAEYMGLLGAALYRKGDLRAAAGKLEAGIRDGPQQLGVQWRKLVLAMAYHRLQRCAEAKQLFQEVTEWLKKNVEEKVQEGTAAAGPLSWAHRLDLQLLHHEAMELLKQRAP